jgi:hypothetical protein
MPKKLTGSSGSHSLTSANACGRLELLGPSSLQPTGPEPLKGLATALLLVAEREQGDELRPLPPVP